MSFISPGVSRERVKAMVSFPVGKWWWVFFCFFYWNMSSIYCTYTLQETISSKKICSRLLDFCFCQRNLHICASHVSWYCLCYSFQGHWTHLLFSSFSHHLTNNIKLMQSVFQLVLAFLGMLFFMKCRDWLCGTAHQMFACTYEIFLSILSYYHFLKVSSYCIILYS